MSKNQQFLLITLIILSLAASSALLIDPKIGRALVMKPFHIQSSRTGLASIKPNNLPAKNMNLDQAGYQASLNLSSK